MKILKLALIAGFMLTIANSCKYEGFEDDYDYSTVYFTNQLQRRTFVEDEINSIRIGVVLGGKRFNVADEWVKFTFDDTSGMSVTPYEPLPETYYNFSSGDEFIIEEGSFMGDISMTINPSFYGDPFASKDYYAIPFRLYDTSADSILAEKDSLLLLVTFQSRVFGNYYHNGQVLVRDINDGTVLDTIIYHQEEPVTNSVNIWPLNTTASKTVYTRGIGHYAPSDLTGFYIRVEDDNSLTLEADTVLVGKGFDWQFEQTDGENSYDPETRMMYLSYKFIDVQSGNECIATDTLIFRNRILDGVNQWEF